MWRLEDDDDDAAHGRSGPKALQQLPLPLESNNKEEMFKS
jgi:hypothetical protein